MSTPFNQIIGNNAFAQLLLLHGETVTYRPKVGGSYTRTAVVERNPPAMFDAAGNVVAPSAIVRFHGEATTGIDPNNLNTGGDKIDIALRSGATPTTQNVYQVVSTDGGVTALAVR
jgi:hypothetical protein|tara:strand:+ start:3885 stop:4232 length:348 start_codon:yes stop_codon:yes gene_type:complete